MEDKPNYYAILGISPDATEAEIRRAFRARAKELHPDSKPAGEHEPAIREFNLLTEAHDTLKDPGRRQAYDAEYVAMRRLAIREGRGGRRPRAFAMGLGLGLFLAAVAVGGKVYYGRSGIGGPPKSQESLSAQPLHKPSAPQAAPEEKQAKAVPEQKEEGDAAPPASPRQASADRLYPSPQEPSAKPAISPIHSASQPQESQARMTAAAPPQAPSEAVSPAPRKEPSGERHEGRHSQFAQEVLSLEGEVSGSGGGAAAYRLISLVNAANAIEELNEAALLASKPETVELIQSRIAALREERGDASSRPSYPALQQDDAGVEVAVGEPRNETILRLRPGDGVRESFSDCASCPEMVAIPAGQAVIGSRPEGAFFRPEEAPAHKVSIHLPIAVSKRAVSAENWRACVEAGACRPTLASYLALGPGVPATRVSWFEAKSYAEWLSQRTGRRYRLLSEAEWEYMARAGKNGGEAAARLDSALGGRSLAFGPLGLESGAGPWTGSRPNAWGVYPLQRDLLEWVEDCWHGGYGQAPAGGSAWLSAGGGDCSYRVVRGAVAGGGEFGAKRIAARAREFADVRSPKLGFRVAREISLPARAALDARAAPALKSGRGE